MPIKANMPESKHIHFIGIGGIGMSAAAQLALGRGFHVSGSDQVASEIVDMLVKKGAHVVVGSHDAKNLPAQTDLAVHSNAIQQTNPELQAARERSLQVQTYYQFVGDLMADKKQLVVTGMHGKSTTTAMLAHVLMTAHLDPSVLIGTKVSFLPDGGNSRLGQGEYMAIEGDEYMKGFLGYHPFGAIVNNIEEEHLDVYKNLKEIVATFRKFVENIPSEGVLAYNGGDENIRQTLSGARCRMVSFGIDGDYDVVGTHAVMKDGKMQVAVHEKKEGKLHKLGTLLLAVPGMHNAMNALGVVALGRAIGLAFSDIKKGLEEFHGTWRRLEFLGDKNGVTFYDDYGHHPTEIKATVEALRGVYPDRRIMLVLQLHQYQRVASLYEKFVRVLKEIQSVVDLVVLTDFYVVEGRDDESLRDKVNAARLATDSCSCGEHVMYVPKEKLAEFLKSHVRAGDVLLTQGAGDITTVGRIFMANF